MDEWGLLGRVLLAGLVGYLVGWERHVRGRPAGERTFALLAMGAAGFTVAGTFLAPSEPGKVLAGVATGIGFIGAGLVFRTGGMEVHGLTTATAAWATAALAVIIGLGAYVVGVGSAVAILFLLEIPYAPGLRYLDPRRYAHRFRTDTDPPGQGGPS